MKTASAGNGETERRRNGDCRRFASESAFTMVEIAISLAIIGFALVAIIGVLPRGLEVQKENRQDTIINHEAGYWMDAIRHGARGLDELTNYVMGISNFWTVFDTNSIPWQPIRSDVDGYIRTASRVTSETVASSYALSRGSNIIGLLTRPKLEYVGNLPGHGPTEYQSNHVVAFVRALSGSAAEKLPQTNTDVLSLAFTYRMLSEVVPVPVFDTTNSSYGKNLEANLRELRLLFTWPLLPTGNTGNGRQSYRSLVGGELLRKNDFFETAQRLYFFEPTTFVTAP